MLTWHEAWCFDCGVLLRKKKQVGGLLCARCTRRLVVVSGLVSSLLRNRKRGCVASVSRIFVEP